jgi:hypothetical protein
MAIPASSQSPAIDARQILDINYAFAQTATLIAAVRLHLFTVLAEKPLHVRELADRMYIDPQAHVLRFIGEQRAKKLLQRVVKSLRPHGTLVIADIFLAEDQQGPKSAITLNLSMLVNTKQGTIRTWREIADWLTSYGLQHVQSFHVAGPFPIVFAEKE